MNKNITIIFSLLLTMQCFSQVESFDYLGQTPPDETPVIFAPDIVSVADRYEYGISFAPDGSEIFFTAEMPGEGLMRIAKDGDNWGQAMVANLRQSNYWEFEAFYKSSGDTLFFTSKTSADNGSSQLYYTTKDGDNWGDAILLDSPVNDAEVMWCTFAENGNMYYTDVNSEEIYCSRYENGEYLAGELLNQGMHPFVADDESYYLYDNAGSIYIRFRNADNSDWLDAVELNSEINTADYEGCPCLSPDGNYLFFSRYIDKSDIYWVSADFIEELQQDALTGISSGNIKNNDISIYQDLSQKEIHITMEQINEYTFVDIDGRILLKGALASGNISIDGLKSGVYFLNIETTEGILTRKIIIE